MTKPDGLEFAAQFRILIHTVSGNDGNPYPLAAIAKSTGISEQNLSNLLDGRTPNPRLDTLRRLCRFYEISLDYFDCDTEVDCLAFLEQRAAHAASPIVFEINQESSVLGPSAKQEVLRLFGLLRQLRNLSKHDRKNDEH